jgi:hypothetical protein
MGRAEGTMSTRLIDKVAEARTPAEALKVVSAWLEDGGMPTAGMAVYREITDVAIDWRGAVEFKVVQLSENALEEEYEKGYADAKAHMLAEAESL